MEKKSAAERGQDAGRKVQELLGQQNERKEATNSFVRQHAGALRRLLKAGGQVCCGSSSSSSSSSRLL